MRELTIKLNSSVVLGVACKYADTKANMKISAHEYSKFMKELPFGDPCLEQARENYDEDYSLYWHEVNAMKLMQELIGIRSQTALTFMRIARKLNLLQPGERTFREYRRDRVIADKILSRLIDAQY